MISSMTGFGRAEIQDPSKKITVELKSVNNKYLDCSIKMPRKFNVFEGEIRNLLKVYATRGKVDMFIYYENLAEGAQSLRYNRALAGEYFKYYCQINEDFNLGSDVSASAIARCTDVLVLEEEEIDEEALWNDIRPVLEEAFAAFRASRAKEGEALKDNILVKLDEMQEHCDFIEARVPEIIEAYKARLKEKVKEFLEAGQMDEGRIAAEVTVYADKIAVDEEMVRLKTHIKHMRDILIKGGEIGRNLDFIAQEMNREANTTLSKSADIDITNRGIELKTCIEKIREQVQNIE